MDLGLKIAPTKRNSDLLKRTILGLRTLRKIEISHDVMFKMKDIHLFKRLVRAHVIVPTLFLLAACQTSTSTSNLSITAGESSWIKYDQRDAFIRLMQQNDLVPVKIECRYTKEEFPKVEYKLWTKKVPGLSPRTKKVVTEFRLGWPYHESEKDNFKNKPTIHVMYYPRMQQWHSCIIPSPYY